MHVFGPRLPLVLFIKFSVGDWFDASHGWLKRLQPSCDSANLGSPLIFFATRTYPQCALHRERDLPR